MFVAEKNILGMNRCIEHISVLVKNALNAPSWDALPYYFYSKVVFGVKFLAHLNEE